MGRQRLVVLMRMLRCVSIGYNIHMIEDTLSFFLRFCVIVTLWVWIWRVVEPKTQVLRIARAALLVLGLVFVLTLMRISEN